MFNTMICEKSIYFVVKRVQKSDLDQVAQKNSASMAFCTLVSAGF